MCTDPQTPEYAAKTAAEKLATLMENKLNLASGTIQPTAFRLFIQAYWSRVSALAHTIHQDN